VYAFIYLVDLGILLQVTIIAWALLITYRVLGLRLFTPEDDKEKVMACPICGSRDISGLKHDMNWLKRDGATMGVYTCQRCGHRGPPIYFDSEDDRIWFKEFKDTKEKIGEDEDNI